MRLRGSYGVVTAILNHMPSAMKYRRRFSVKKYAICDFNVPCGKIADLIDRPTCLDLVEHKQDPFIPGKRMVDGYFHCSDCGWDGQIWEYIGFGDMLAYEAVHCPKCGAIIERRA